MNRHFSLTMLKQTWLADDVTNDLCSHGSLLLYIGGQQITWEDEQFGISESALALLRSIERDHRPDAPVAERLLLHGCGVMLMGGCNIGVDWKVTHQSDTVELRDIIHYTGNGDHERIAFPAISVVLPRQRYIQEVVHFATQAKVFFEGIDKNVEANELWPGEYQQFWDEYHALLRKYTSE